MNKVKPLTIARKYANDILGTLNDFNLIMPIPKSSFSDHLFIFKVLRILLFIYTYLWLTRAYM